MKTSTQAVHLVLGGLVLMGATVVQGFLWTPVPAGAQTIFRDVGTDGRVSYSDIPPAAADKAKIIAAQTQAMGSSGMTLPYVLRQVVNKYPVTLYTTENCSPCDAGRALLIVRGIPFSEYTVTSTQDFEMLKHTLGESAFPVLMIGTQPVQAYSENQWTQFLNAADYPLTSQLPRNYQNPAAMPLVKHAKRNPD